MDKKEWIERRRKGIGGTDIATIIGHNPYKTKVQLWLEKTQGIEPVETLQMKIGKFIEPIIAEEFEKEFGFKLEKNSELILDKENPILIGTPDYYYKQDKTKGILECKNTNKEVDKCPIYYTCQVQWYLGLAGLAEGYIAFLIKNNKMYYEKIEFDKDFYEYMKEEALKFYNEYILTNTPPEPQTIEDVKVIYPKSISGKEKDVDEGILMLYEEIKQTEEKIRPDIKRLEELKDMLRIIFEDNEILKYGNKILATYKSSKDVLKFDIDKFKKENPELYEKYIYTIQGQRKLLIK